MTTAATGSPHNDLLLAALDYARRGWSVFPLHTVRGGRCTCNDAACKSPGKHPDGGLVFHGLNEASTDPATIRQWWNRRPAANVGIACGPSGLLVLDIDAAHGGEDALEMLERQHGALPPTAEVLTGGGGRHLYCRRPEGDFRNTAGTIGAGLDTRAIGGYVVAPPSLHISGKHYEWEATSGPDTTLADPPAWLLSRTKDPAPVKGAEARDTNRKIPEGKRNGALTSIAGTLQRKGLTAPAILAALRAENAARCTPPLDDSELQSIVASIGRYPPAAPYLADAATDADGEPDGPQPLPAHIDVADFLAEDLPMADPIIDGVLRRGETATTVSASKARKSWNALNLCAAVATGGEWLGLHCRHGRALLVDCELQRPTLQHRMDAVLRASGLAVEDVRGRLRVTAWRGQTVTLAGLAAYLAAIEPGEFDLIVLDPIFRLYPKGFDENDNAAMAGLFGTFQALAERAQSALLLVAHTPKGDVSGRTTIDLVSGAGSAGRAVDVAIALRAHEASEPGAPVIVRETVARSFADLPPECFRWQHPRWVAAPELDPADLKRPGGRTRKRKDNPPDPAEARPVADESADFAGRFIGADPQPRGAIIDAAIRAGFTENRAKKLLSRAEGRGLAHRWTDRNPAKGARFASVEQPKLDVEGGES